MKSVRPKKFLGQHFLTHLPTAQAIADTIDACPDIPVLEVGPGMGVMTQFILPKKREFKVVEIDFESVAYLREHFPELEDNIIEDDFLKMHLDHTFNGRPFVLTGNYPYNISSQIFFKMLDYRHLIPCCTGMIQKEVAERLAAIRMTRNQVQHPGCDEDLLRHVVKTTFNQRRKMMRGSIKPLLHELDQKCGTTPPNHTSFLAQELLTKRPEQLSVQAFIDLTNQVTQHYANCLQ